VLVWREVPYLFADYLEVLKVLGAFLVQIFYTHRNIFQGQEGLQDYIFLILQVQPVGWLLSIVLFHFGPSVPAVCRRHSWPCWRQFLWILHLLKVKQIQEDREGRRKDGGRAIKSI